MSNNQCKKGIEHAEICPDKENCNCQCNDDADFDEPLPAKQCGLEEGECESCQ